MEAALVAGSKDAATASATTKRAASDRTSGSNGLTAKSSESSKREAAAAAINPTAQPASASFTADKKTNPKIPKRCDPNAIRIAISCTRIAVENAMTL